jgi:hypothetical protein
MHALRPKRFDMKLPIRYRHAGTGTWHKGTSENVSCSGVLFKGRHSLGAYEPVEVEMQLPKQLTGDTPVFLNCRGYIARVVETRMPFAKPELAAAFLDFKVRYSTRAEKDAAPVLDTSANDTRHLLNNMLAAIIGNSELLLASDSQNPQFIRQCAERIMKAAEHAAEELNKRTRKQS